MPIEAASHDAQVVLWYVSGVGLFPRIHSMLPRPAVLLLSFGVVLLTAATASASDPSPDDDLVGAPRKLVLRPLPDADTTEKKPAERRHAEERPFVHALDPSTPTAGDVTAEYGVGMSSGSAVERPLPTSSYASGVAHSFTVGFGATDRLAPFAGGRVVQSEGGNEARGGGVAGVRWQVTRPGAPFRLTLAGAGFREAGGTGAFGAYTRLAMSYDVDRLRIAGNLHTEKAFASGRDGLDVLAIAGASYRAAEIFRVGAEYVGQDLEDAVEQEEAEGGARHFLGPTVALDVDSGRVQVVAGPSFGLNENAPRLLGRLALLVAF
jgi:hypothetical protein